jgi:hypothetical protein
MGFTRFDIIHYTSKNTLHAIDYRFGCAILVTAKQWISTYQRSNKTSTRKIVFLYISEEFGKFPFFMGIYPLVNKHRP